MSDSRIHKSIANAKVNMIFYVLTALFAFFSRRIFIDNLGLAFLGMSSTLGDMLNLMNITELGIGTAVAVTLYKPLYDNDHNKINDIISVFGFLYSRVGFIIVTIGIILSCFFPIFFKNSGLPLYLSYFIYFSLLYSSLIGYFINYKQIILSASQQNYVINIRYNTLLLIKTLIQISVSYLPLNYIWYISVEIITTTLYTIIINKTIKKYYPWLDASRKRGKDKFKIYKDLWVKTKQVFVLKLSHLIMNNSVVILTSIFGSLSLVALYGNYNMLMSKITSLVDGLFTGMEASVGNLIAEGNKVRIKQIFYELLCIRYFLAGVISVILYFTVPSIITIWLGAKYILPKSILILLSIHIFVQQARITVDNFKNGYGIYNDVWAPIAEVLINVSIAITLGLMNMGLSGILIGMITSEIIIKMIWKPYYLFKIGFAESVYKYYWPLILKYLITILTTIMLIKLILIKIIFIPLDSWFNIILYCLVISTIILLIMSLLFLIIDKNFRIFINHIKSYIRK